MEKKVLFVFNLQFIDVKDDITVGIS